MAKMRLRVVKYGYAVVEAESEREAIEKTIDMSDSDFDRSDFNDARVVDSSLKFDQIIKENKQLWKY